MPKRNDMHERINTPVINQHVQQFVSQWKGLRRHLLDSGYMESTMETYHAANFKLRNDMTTFEVLRKTRQVNKQKMDEIIQMTQRNELTFVALSYPTLGDFTAFFYRRRDPEVDSLLEERLGFTNDPSTTVMRPIGDVTEALDDIRLSSSPELYHRVNSMLDLMNHVREFTDNASEIVFHIQRIMRNYVNATNTALNRAMKQMIAVDYVKFEDREVRKIKDIADRIVMNIDLLMQIGEN